MILRALVLVSLLTACGGGTPSTMVVTDSAGVRIVASTGAAWDADAGWRIDSASEQVVGDASRADGALLVGVVGVHRMSDGGVAVVVAEDRAVLLFRADGALAARVTGSVDTLDDFRRPSLLGVRGDSLLVWDAGRGRLTVLDPGGGVARTVAFAVGEAPVGMFPDGSLVLTVDRPVPVAGGVGLQRDALVLLHRAVGVARTDTIGVVAGDEVVVASTATFRTAFPRPFGAQTTVALNAPWVQVSTGDSDDILRLRVDGSARETWRLERARRAIPPAALRAHGLRRGAQVAQLPEVVRAKVIEAMVAAGVPAAMPTHDRQLVDPTGHTWLRVDQGPERPDSAAQPWVVLDPDGRWLGEVRAPRGLTLLEVQRDRVLGTWRDPYGVEHVRVHRLRR